GKVNRKTSTIIGSIEDNKKISLILQDLTRQRQFRIEVAFTDPEMRTLKWTTGNPLERVFYPRPNPKIWEGQTVPSGIILHKISHLTKCLDFSWQMLSGLTGNYLYQGNYYY